MKNRAFCGVYPFHLGYLVALLLLAGCGEMDAPWTTAGSLLEARSFHSATLLEDESVLFAGGSHGDAFVPRAERRKTTTGRWSIGAPMIEPRSRHAALRLNDGRVVLIGGRGEAGTLKSVEIYDPMTGQFSPLEAMPEPREGPTATLVSAGPEALETIVVTGGIGPMGPLKTTVLYDVAAGQWRGSTDAMAVARSGHTATRLDDGQVLVLGGTDGAYEQQSAEVYDAIHDDWSEAGDLRGPRSEFSATRHREDMILVVGGKVGEDELESAEEYLIKKEQNGPWPPSQEVGSLREARRGHTATRLDDGSVLVVGGIAGGHPIASVERYNPATHGFEQAPAMAAPRQGHTATGLADGSVLVAGGNAETLAERFVLDDAPLPCEHTLDCPSALVCNAESFCERPANEAALDAVSACSAIPGAPPAGSGCFLLGLVSMLAASRRRRARGVFSLSLLALLFVPRLARAQTSTFFLDRLLPAGGLQDGVAVVRPVFGETQAYAQAALGYAKNPLRVEAFVHDAGRARALEGAAVSDQLTGYFTFGAEILRRGSIQVTLPYIATQDGYPTDNRRAGLEQPVALAPSALGDIRVEGRALLAWSESRAFSLAARGALLLPTGDVMSFAGERGAWGQAGLAAEMKAEAFFVTANLGITVRPKSALVDLGVGTELTYAAGVYVPFMQDGVRLGLEVFGAAGLLPETSGGAWGFPAEASLSTRVAFGPRRLFFLGLGGGVRIGSGYAPDARFLARIGGALPFGRTATKRRAPVSTGPLVPEFDSDDDGIPDLYDLCPLIREDYKTEEDGCPDTDEDRDGIDADVDACPRVAEDKDGIDDVDGCPEEDADEDGISDAVDKCPKEPGGHSEDRDNEGCPAFIRRINEEVVLAKQFEFEFDSVTLSPASYPILDEIVKLLAVSRDIKRLRIEGHTDNVGGEAYNADLSRRRAQAVREYLVERGKVAPSRLLSLGFGQSRPLAPNTTAEGRAKNRRVELHIETAAGTEEKKP